MEIAEITDILEVAKVAEDAKVAEISEIAETPETTEPVETTEIKKPKYIPPGKRLAGDFVDKVSDSKKNLMIELNNQYRRFRQILVNFYFEQQQYLNLVITKKSIEYIKPRRATRRLHRNNIESPFKLPIEIFLDDPFLFKRYTRSVDKLRFISALEEFSQDFDYDEYEGHIICSENGCRNTALKYRFAKKLCLDCHLDKIETIRSLSPGLCVAVKAVVPGTEFSGKVLNLMLPNIRFGVEKIYMFNSKFDYTVEPLDEALGSRINCGHPTIQIKINNLHEMATKAKESLHDDADELVVGDNFNGYIITAVKGNYTCLNAFYGICKSVEGGYAAKSFEEAMFLPGKTYVSVTTDLTTTQYGDTGDVKVSMFCRACMLRNEEILEYL